MIEPRGVEEVTVDVELELLHGGVADAHWPRTAVAIEVPELDLGEEPLASDAVHDLQVLGPPRGGALHPAHERVRFLGVAKGEQGVEVERRVPQPRVAVVPVSHPAHILGQGGRGGGHDGSCGRVGERLEHQGTAHHLIAIGPLVGATCRPVDPETTRDVDAGPHLIPVDAVDVELVGQGVGEGDEGLVACAQVGLPGAAANLHLGDRQFGLEHQGVGPAVDDRDVAAQLEARDGEPVVEAGSELDVDADTPSLAADQSQQLVVGVGSGGVGCPRPPSHGHAIDHDQHAVVGFEASLEDVGAGAVATGHRVAADGSDAEVPAAIPVEEAGEHRAGVEAVEAAPVDRAVPGDEGGGVAVADEGVVADGRVGGGFSRRGDARRRRTLGDWEAQVVLPADSARRRRWAGRARRWRRSLIAGQVPPAWPRASPPGRRSWR